jgi:GNAT superfamily N-acetyltransferase
MLLDVLAPVNGGLPRLKVSAPDDWRMLRLARLAALQDSPHAFASSHARESAWRDSKWQRLFKTSTWVVAREGQDIIGLAKSVKRRWRPASRYVESVWVAPAHRRRGVLRALLYQLVETCRPTGVTELLLWVLVDNQAAHNAYLALGFVPTGKPHRLRSVGRFEQRFRLEIGVGTPTVEPTRRALPLGRLRAKLGASPDLKLQEVHCLTRAANIVDAGGESLPVAEVIPPGIKEIQADVWRESTKLIFGGRQ